MPVRYHKQVYYRHASDSILKHFTYWKQIVFMTVKRLVTLKIWKIISQHYLFGLQKVLLNNNVPVWYFKTDGNETTIPYWQSTITHHMIFTNKCIWYKMLCFPCQKKYGMYHTTNLSMYSIKVWIFFPIVFMLFNHQLRRKSVSFIVTNWAQFRVLISHMQFTVTITNFIITMGSRYHTPIVAMNPLISYTNVIKADRDL